MLVAARASVIVPTYNEAENIEGLVRRVCAAMPDAEILVIDDDSPDGTAERARELARNFPVRVIVRTEERGLATAALRGIAESSCDVCVVMDADLSHPPEMIPELVRAVEDGADLAIGSRYVSGGDIDTWPMGRRLVSRTGTALARPLTSALDPLAGFFCLRRGLLAAVTLKPRGFKILLEILARTRPARVMEIPIRFSDRECGASKFGSFERRSFLRQLWTLYRDLNAWPWRLLKFLATGAAGYVVHLAVLCALVEVGGLAPMIAAVGAFSVAMTSNYAINKQWTFRAGHVPLVRSYLVYAVGAIGGLATQLGVMCLLASLHYVLAASLGIAAGTAFTFLTSHRWAFAKR